MPSVTRPRTISAERCLLAGLVLVNVLVFGRIVFHSWVMWDDPHHVFNNPLVRQWWGQPWEARLGTPQFGYPIPLPVAIYAACWEMLGEQSAWAVHSISTLLHLVNTILVCGVVRRWSSNTYVGLAAGTIWSLHPIVCESVAWASNLNELFVAAGILGGVYVWERMIEGGERRLAVGLLVAALVAVASKPTAAILGGYIVVRTWFGGDENNGLYVYGAGAVAAVVTIGWALVHRLGWSAHVADIHNEATTGPWGIVMANSAGLYIRNYLWPLELHPVYQYIDFHRVDIMAALGLAGLVTGAGLVAASLYTRRRMGLPVCFAAIAYLPYSNVVSLPRIASDTYMYLPTVGVAAGLAWGGRRCFEWIGQDVTARKVMLSAACLIVVAWTSLASLQTGRWSSTEQLFEPLLGTPERLALPYGLVAYDKYRGGRVNEAAALLEAAWPHLKQGRALPRIAPRIFLEAGGRERAAEARLRAALVYGEGRGAWADAFEFLLTHDLPPPEGGRAGELFWQSLSAWQATQQESGLESLSNRRVQDYLAAHGFRRTAD